MTYRSPLLNTDKAIGGIGLDEGVALHYGQPVLEQRALSQGSAIVDVSNRGVIELHGPDALKILHILSSQSFEGESWQKPTSLPASTETMFFDLQGRIEYAPKVLITELGDSPRIYLLTESDETAAVADWITKMRFMMQLEITDVTDQFAAVIACTNVAAWQEFLCWTDPWPDVTHGGYSYAAMDQADHPGHDYSFFTYLLPRERFSELVEEVLAEGYSLAGTSALEALRVAACRPRWGKETDERTIAHELDWLRTAVHMNKGCYKGQETVARVHNLGRPPRRLVLLHIDGSQHTLVTDGAAVLQQVGDKEREIGKVTSAALHHEMGQIALALIRRNTDPAETLVISDTPAEGAEPVKYAAAQELIVSPEAGQVVGRPKGIKADRSHRDMRR